MALKVLATGTGPNEQRPPHKSAAGMWISANFLIFALSRSNLGNNKVNKTNMHGAGVFDGFCEDAKTD